MKKLFTFFAVLTLSAGLWAETQTVSYYYPVYKTNGDVTSGIKELKIGEVEATIVTDSYDQVIWDEGWYVVTGANVRLFKGAVCNGAVHLILADGATLIATGGPSQAGIRVSGKDNALTIYGQKTQSGQLIANGGSEGYKGGAGIGGGYTEAGSNITINGGVVKAHGGFQSASIGGGYQGPGFNITINGGTVMAIGYENNDEFYSFANISGSHAEGLKGSAIIINGEEHDDIRYNSAGIGGSCAEGHHITINGGIITATAGFGGAAIGGGGNARGSYITINGGIITAEGGTQAAGIGGGSWKGANNISITGGFVTATGGNYATGLGGGYNSFGELEDVYDISITGGTIIANKGWGATTAIGVENSNKAKFERMTVSSALIVKIGDEIIEHNSDEDISVKFIEKEHVSIFAYSPISYGENITVKPTFNSGEEIKGGTKITFTARNRESEGYVFLGFFTDSECKNIILDGVSGLTYTTYTAGPLSVYAKYEKKYPSVTFGSYLTVNPELQSGDTIEGGTKVTFTATDRWAEGYDLIGFFSDSDCKNAITEGVSGLTYTTTVGINPVAVYVMYKLVRVDVACDEHFIISPALTRGMADIGSQVTFTAIDRTKDNYKFKGLFADSTYQQPLTEGVSGQTYTTTIPKFPISVYAKYVEYVSADYVDADGEQKTCPKACVVTSSAFPEIWDEEWYIVRDADVQLEQGAFCRGDVHLILADGAKLVATGRKGSYADKIPYSAGIEVSGGQCSLTIYGQLEQTGKLEAEGTLFGAGIGGGERQANDPITINGGNIKATGNTGAAGIGGGSAAEGKNITINGGKVRALGGWRNVMGEVESGAGIGGGTETDGHDITINGGEVTASGAYTNNGPAAIGGGYKGNGYNITITGGTVVADGQKAGAGIGGGAKGYGYDISILGGTVMANGGAGASAIGWGKGGESQWDNKNLYVADGYFIRADNTTPPTTFIDYTSGEDLMPKVGGKQYVVIGLDTLPMLREGAIAAVQDSAEVVENAIATLGLKDESLARSKQVVADIVDTATARITAAWKQEPILLAQQTAYEALDARWQYDLAFAPIEKARTEAGRALDDSVAKAKTWIENASIEDRYKEGPLSKIDYVYNHNVDNVLWGKTFEEIDYWTQRAFAELAVQVQEFLAVVAQFEQDKLAAIATIDSTAEQARLTIEAIPSDITGQYYKNWAYDELANTVNEYTALINESDNPAYVTSRKNLAISAINTTLKSAKSNLDKYISLKIEKEAVMLTIQDSADRAKLIVPTVTDDESIKAASITAIDAIVSSSASSLAAAKSSNTLNTIQQNAFSAFANQIQTLYQDAAFAVKKAEAISYINKVSETAIAEINNAGEGDYLRDLKDDYISQVTKKARTSITYINKATVQHDIDYWTAQMDTEISNILPSALNAIHAAVVLHDAQALALSQMEDSLASAKAIVEACVIEQVVKDRAVKSMESAFVLCKKAILNNPIDTAAVMREKGTCLNEIFYQVMFVLRSAAELAAAQSEDLTAIQDSATSAKALINAAIVADTVKTSALSTIDTTVTKAVNTIEKALALNQFSTVKDPVLSTIGEQVKLVKAHASTLSYEKRLAIDYIEGRERTVISAVNAASSADYVQPIQQAAIDEMNATATQAINGINASFIREDILVIRNTTGTSLEAIKTQALATIRAAVALHENQAQALKDITASVANAKAQISLAKVEELIKTNAATAIDNAVATATDAIGVATTLEAISEARQTALTAIAEQVELVQNADAQLAQVRSEAQDAIYHTANAAIVAINGAEAGEYAQPIKEQAITSISETEVSATSDINAALTAEAVTTTKETAVTMIETIQTQALEDIAALVSLTQAQAQAVSAVQDSALIVKEQMETLDLSDSVRTAYLSSIDSTVAVNTDAIYKTSTLAEVATAQQAAFAALATQWQTISETYQDQLAQAKSEGIAAINGAKTEAIEAITQASDAECVQTIQQTAIAAITTTATESVTMVSEVVNISEIEPITNEALDSIEITKTQALADISALVNLTEAKTTALASIQDAATNAKALIKAAIVEQIIKTSALMSIDETATNATTTIEAATTVEEVQTIEQTTLTTIQTLLQSVLDTDAKAKNNAIAAITKAKDDAYYELLYSANSADVATIKQTAMDAVVSTAADSIASIKAVTEVEAILPIQEGAIASINTIKEEALALILAVPTLFDAQQEALTTIQDSATNAKAVIENLVVNTELKTPATLAISDAYSEAYNAITMAGTVVAVHAAKQTAFAAYGAQVQLIKDAATELAQAKSEAIAAINAAAEQARTNINSASSEDYVQSIKDAALDELAYSVSYSTKGINNTLYVSIIPSLKTNGLNGIKTIETQALADIEAAVALHDAKDAAAIALTDSATFAKGLVAHEVIDNPTKAQAVTAIDAALATALTDIPTAETLQAIETMKQTALTAFAAQVQIVKDAATELAQAKTTYIATIQNKAAETIAEIRNASDEDCARSIQDNAAKTINSLVRMGEIDINAAMTVNDVVGIWFDVIDPAISAIKTQALTNIATTVLNHTRETSMKAVQDSANSATTIIENAIAIQTVKDEALAAIQTIVETAINAIQMADVAELMQTAVTTAFAAIDEQVVIVRREAGVLAEAKSSALIDINDAIATAKLVITSSGGDIDYIQPIKDAALASLEQVTAKVPEDINSAMDTETITTIKDRAITEIDAIRDKAVEDITTLIELTQERVTLLNKVKSQAGMSKNVINQTEVSSSIKTMAVTAIDNALATALTNMEAAELLSELTNAYNTAVAIFEAQVQAVTDAAAKEAQEKAALADAKTQALAAIQSAVTSAKQAINQAATGYEYEAKGITEPAFALITTTDSTASAGIQTALTIAAIAPIKEQALMSIEATKTQAIEEINALIASILAKQAVLQEAKDAAKVQVQDSAANAFEAVKYLFVTPNVIYKAQDDLDYAESEALSRINYCSTVAEVDGEVEFAFARFAEIVAEAKSMEGGEETKIVPLYGTETTVAPTEEDVTITWPVYEEAESYTLIITEEGDTIYEIKFDTDGVRVGAPRRAPSMDGVNLAPAADLTMQGYQYTVSGLTTETHYGYKVISQTVDNTVIYQNGGGFMTSTDPTPTGINSLPYEGKAGKGSFKVMENHTLRIIRDGKRYTILGVGE